MFPVSLIIKTYSGVDISNMSEEDKKKKKLKLSIKDLELVAHGSFKMGQKSGRTDEESF